MSQENVEVVRSALGPYEGEDLARGGGTETRNCGVLGRERRDSNPRPPA